MKNISSKNHLKALLAALALPAGFASGQTAVPAPSGVNLQSTGNITNGPAVILPNSVSATPISPAFSWEGSNQLQGFVLPVSNFTGRTTAGGTVNYEDLLPLKVTKLQVMQGIAGAAPSGVSTLIDATGIDTASVITDVLKIKDSSTGTDATLTMVNGKLEANNASVDAQTLSLSGNTLSISGGNSVSLPASGGSGTVTSVASGTGLSGGPITSSGTLSLANTAVTAGNYGSASAIPTFTVDAQGRLTAAASVALPDTSATNEIQTLGLSGNTLSLSNGGGSVSLAGLNTDAQSLSVSGNTMNISGGTGATVPNLYTADGTLTGARTVTMGANALSFNATSGDVIINLNEDGSGHLALNNTNTGTNAHGLFQIKNDTSNGFSMFLNSSTRVSDGGVNSATLRNDAGDLHLQSGGSYGVTIRNGTGYPEWIQNINGTGGMWIRNISSGTDAITALAIGNNGQNNLYMFLNSSNRTTEGGANTATLRNDAGDLRIQSGGAYGMTIRNQSGYVQFDQNVDSQGGMWIRNISSGTNSFTSLALGNNGASNLYMFLNSSNRTTEGGANTATLRNDAGNMRIQAAGSHGLTIDGTAGTTTFSTDTFAPSFTNTSDRRLKDQITSTRHSLWEVMAMEVVDYFYKSDKKTLHTGFIAQDLYKVYPEAVVVGGDDPATRPWGVDYAKLTPLLTKAIQEQQGQIEAVKKRLITSELEKAALSAQVKAQEGKLAAQTKSIEALKKTQHAEIAQIKAALEQMRQLVVLKTADKAAAKNAVSAR